MEYSTFISKIFAGEICPISGFKIAAFKNSGKNMRKLDQTEYYSQNKHRIKMKNAEKKKNKIQSS